MVTILAKKTQWVLIWALNLYPTWIVRESFLLSNSVYYIYLFFLFYIFNYFRACYVCFSLSSPSCLHLGFQLVRRIFMFIPFQTYVDISCNFVFEGILGSKEIVSIFWLVSSFLLRTKQQMMTFRISLIRFLMT